MEQQEWKAAALFLLLLRKLTHKTFPGRKGADSGSPLPVSVQCPPVCGALFIPASVLGDLSKMIQKLLQELVNCYRYFHLSTLINTRQVY